MKLKIMNVLKYLAFVLFPILSVFLCLALGVAQGERNEEIVFGVLLGIALDLIYSLFLFMISKNQKGTKTAKRIMLIFCLALAIVLGFAFSRCCAQFEECNYQSAKDDAENFLKRNREELENIAKDIFRDKQVSVTEYKRVHDIDYDAHEDAVNFAFDSQGALGGQYWRLVYTEKGEYLGEAQRYIYYEKDHSEGGNNIIFAEKIIENWYFYWIDYDGREDLSNMK